MKTFTFLTALAMTVIITSCGVMGQTSGSSTSTISAAASSLTSSGSSNGQAAGAALKSLYTQYKADGKLDMTNLSNILNLATLTQNIQGLKGQSDKSAFYKDFASGLILGSSNLVTQNTASSVMSGLTSLVSNVDLSGLQNKAAQVTDKTSNAVSTATAAISNASAIADSVTSIMNLFKK